MKNTLAFLICGFFLTTAGLGAAVNDPKDEKAVMDTLHALAQATMNKDVATLDKIYHPDLTFSHSSALNETKAQVLDRVGRGITKDMTFSDTTIRIYGHTALARGRHHNWNGMPGNLRENDLNILWVLLKGPGPYGWQVVARQTTRLPEPKK
jgi:hypothetical protein